MQADGRKGDMNLGFIEDAESLFQVLPCPSALGLSLYTPYSPAHPSKKSACQLAYLYSSITTTCEHQRGRKWLFKTVGSTNRIGWNMSLKYSCIGVLWDIGSEGYCLESTIPETQVWNCSWVRRSLHSKYYEYSVRFRPGSEVPKLAFNGPSRETVWWFKCHNDQKVDIVSQFFLGGRKWLESLNGFKASQVNWFIPWIINSHRQR